MHAGPRLPVHKHVRVYLCVLLPLPHCVYVREQVPVWRVSWSITGNILAVSDGKDNVSLWKEAVDGQWQQISA